MISVVIPAHNETAVIGRCLRALVEGAALGDVEIIVVCNGCTDDTAAIARLFAGVKVIETSVASKSHALNLGDKAVTGFPRFFIDADVVMPRAALLETAKVLDEGIALAAAPRMAVDLSGSNWLVRSFYRIWTRLPYFRKGMIGSGAYGLSEAGRRRFEGFAAITADDAFVRLHFDAAERVIVPSCTFTITAPRTLRGVIKIKTRGHFGNLELAKRFPHLLEKNETRHGGAMLSLATQPRLWPSLAVYVYVRVVSRLLSYKRYRFGDHEHWERDDSSRQIAPST
ncbi:MAG: glycosyltransferase family 2 protein [Tepidisphaeraceae bacterium]